MLNFQINDNCFFIFIDCWIQGEDLGGKLVEGIGEYPFQYSLNFKRVSFKQGLNYPPMHLDGLLLWGQIDQIMNKKVTKDLILDIDDGMNSNVKFVLVFMAEVFFFYFTDNCLS